jgi:hypothetical protein
MYSEQLEGSSKTVTVFAGSEVCAIIACIGVKTNTNAIKRVYLVGVFIAVDFSCFESKTLMMKAC